MPASNRRDHLVETALTLFASEGFHATGIDRILAEAGVAKMTLYKHFRSKDDLIVAALRLRSERFQEDLAREVERRARRPVTRLLAMFDVLGDWFRSRDFAGCTLVNASAEFGDPSHPAHAAAAEHKRRVGRYVRDLAETAGARDPGRLSEQLILLLEGATVLAQVCGTCDAATRAKEAARTLIAAAT